MLPAFNEAGVLEENLQVIQAHLDSLGDRYRFEVLLVAFIATVLGMGNLHRVAVWSILIGVILNVFSWKLPTQFGTLFIFTLMFAYLLWASRSGAMARH